MAALDPYMPQYHVNEVHARELAFEPENALARVLALPAATDPIVRFLFRLRRVAGGDLPIERFAPEALHLNWVARTTTTAVATGRLRHVDVGISFDAEQQTNGCRLVTETRVHALDRRALIAFRAYWLVVGPWSALIRRRWLRAVASD